MQTAHNSKHPRTDEFLTNLSANHSSLQTPGLDSKLKISGCSEKINRLLGASAGAVMTLLSDAGVLESAQITGACDLVSEPAEFLEAGAG